MWVHLGQSSTLSGNEAACPISGCSDRIWDIFTSLNLSYQDEDAGVFKFLVAQKLVMWRAMTEL